MGIQIHELNALSRAPQTGDVFAIDTGTDTAKIDYNALATAIINKLGGDPVTILHGGTGATTAAGARAALNIYTATRVSTFTNGEATLQFSDVGVTSRPDTVILTPSSGNDIFRYDWDNSANEIKLIAYHPDGSPVNSVARYSILVIP